MMKHDMQKQKKKLDANLLQCDLQEKKMLSATALLAITRKNFEKIPIKARDPRGKERKISLADSLASGLAMFGLKSPSLLAFDQARNDETIKHNLKKLYSIEKAPSDTYMREELDEVDPATLRGSFLPIFEAVQKSGLLERYRFLDNKHLMLLDGTGLFSSKNVNCENCCEKKHKDGSITYYHQAFIGVIAHPAHPQVIPLCPEMISKQDGVAKNDCEKRALQRFLSKLENEHPQLKLTLACDALSANTPTINEIKEYGHSFIINVKPGGNKSLFEWIEGLDLQKLHITVGNNKYAFRYINGIPLNDVKNAPTVNFLECKSTEIDGKKVTETTFTWVTDHKITNENAYLIMKGGRARWKIENETFNTLKNQGYQFDRNFGHGHNHLLEVFTLLMVLAFLIDQIQEATCDFFQAAHQKMISRRALWEKMRCYFYVYFIDSWEDLFTAIGQSISTMLPCKSP
jgi:hypothetical protein